MTTANPYLLGVLTRVQALSLLALGAAGMGILVATAGGAWQRALLAALFFAPLWVNAVIDARSQRLVKAFTHAAAAVLVVVLVLWAFAPDLVAAPWSLNPPITEMATPAGVRGALIVILCSALVGVPLWLSVWLTKGGMIGIGDARLAPVLAGWCALHSVDHVLIWLAVALLAQSLYVLVLLAARRTSLKSRHALGPWLIGAAAVVTLV